MLRFQNERLSDEGFRLGEFEDRWPALIVCVYATEVCCGRGASCVEFPEYAYRALVDRTSTNDARSSGERCDIGAPSIVVNDQCLHDAISAMTHALI